MSERDFISDVLHTVGLSPKQRDKNEVPFKQQPIGLPQQNMMYAEHQNNVSPTGEQPLHPALAPRDVSQKSTSYTSVNQVSLLNQFDIPTIQREYNSKLYTIFDKVHNRNETKKKPTPKEIYDDLPDRIKNEIDEIDTEIQKVDTLIESRLWYLSDTFTVQVPEGNLKLFDLIDNLFKHIRTNDFYSIIEYVKFIIPRFMTIVTIHVKSFEDYETKSELETRKVELYQDWCKLQMDRIVDLESENERMKGELSWESRFLGAKQILEDKLGISGIEDADFGRVNLGDEIETEVEEEEEVKSKKPAKWEELNRQVKSLSNKNVDKPKKPKPPPLDENELEDTAKNNEVNDEDIYST